MKGKIEVNKHELVPKHMKVSDKEKEILMKKFNVTDKDLPRMKKNDPAIGHLGVQSGDVIKIVRKSSTAGESVFYRTIS